MGVGGITIMVCETTSVPAFALVPGPLLLARIVTSDEALEEDTDSSSSVAGNV